MQGPIEMVRSFCAGWSDDARADELAAFFTEDAVYHNIPQEPVRGRADITNAIGSFIRPSGWMSSRSATGRSSFRSWGSSRSPTARSARGGTTST